ncbi:MAG: PEP-utilizing enzyme [Actinomycetota bacterium]
MTDRWLTDWTPSERFPFYTRANSGEIMPDPVTPLGWTSVWGGPVANGWADGCVRWGSMAEEEINRDEPQTIGCFGGYVYLNWSMIRLTGERSPGMSAADMDAAFFGDHPDIPPYVPHPDDQRGDLSAKVEQTMGWLMSCTEIPEELAEDRAKMLAARDARPDFATLSDAEVIQRIRDVQPLVREFFDPYYVYGSASSIGLGMLGALLGETAPTLVGRLVSGLGDIDSAPPSQAIWDLSRMVAASPALTAEFDAGRDGLLDRLAAADGGPAFIDALDAFRFEHGARGPAEWEIASPSWETDPTLVLSLVDRMRLVDDELEPAIRHTAAATDRAAAVAEARELLAGNDEALGTLDLALTMADVFVAGRERTKLTQMMSLHEVRVAADALADRLVDAGHLDTRRQLYMATMDELEQVVSDPAAWAPTLKQREVEHAALSDLQEPFVFIGGEPPMSEWPARTSSATPAAAGEEMQGVPGSPGVVTGRARVITDPADPRGLEPGEILVAPLTDPAWTPLFIPAAGVIVEVGAPMSHAMIVSREFGVPCVTGIVGVAERIPDGALVQMDGSTGQVTVLEV